MVRVFAKLRIHQGTIGKTVVPLVNMTKKCLKLGREGPAKPTPHKSETPSSMLPQETKLDTSINDDQSKTGENEKVPKSWMFLFLLLGRSNIPAARLERIRRSLKRACYITVSNENPD
jgi:hypothetical protein